MNASKRAAVVRRWMLAAWVASVGLPGAAHAKPGPPGSAVGAASAADAAKELFRAGRAAFERGDFRAAAVSFEEAARLAPHPQAWFAAGDAWDSVGDPARAAYCFDRALTLEGLDANKRTIIGERLGALARELGLLRIEGPVGARVAVAHLRGETLPSRVYVEPGEHAIRLIEPAAGAETRTVSAGAGEAVDVVFAAPPPPPAPGKAPLPAPPSDPGDAVKPSATALTLGIAGWSLFGLGLAGAVAAAVVTSEGLSARDEWEADRRDIDQLDRAESLRMWTGITWGVAGAVLATGVVLLVVDAGTSAAEPTEPVAALRVGPTGGTLVTRW